MRLMVLVVAWLLLAASAHAQVRSDVEQEAHSWELVKDSGDVERLLGFITLYPKGAHLDLAIDKLQELSAPVETGVEIVIPTPPQVEVATVQPTAPAMSPAELKTVTVAIQTILRDQQCSIGSADGDWGPRSQQAAATYGVSLGIDLAALAPGQELLDLVKRDPNRICGQPSPLNAAVILYDSYCYQKYRNWRRVGTHRSFAVSVEGNWCSYTEGYGSVRAADQLAKIHCETRGTRQCVIFDHR